MIDIEDSPIIENTVTSTRIRLARNYRAYPFPGRITERQAKDVVSAVGRELCTARRFHRIRHR